MVAVMPSLVERKIQRRFSAARMRTIFKMLLAGGASSEPTVVGDVEQHLGAIGGELAHKVREHRFVADERADLVLADRQDHHLAARREIADFGRDLFGEAERPGNELAERHQVYLVVAADEPRHDGVDQQRRIERRAVGAMATTPARK